MDTTKRLPTSLMIVASLFFLVGIISLVEVIASGTQGRLSINLGVLGLFIGIGLWRLSRAWRTFALVVLWALLLAIPIYVFGDIMLASGTVSEKHARQVSLVTPQRARLALATCGFVWTCWQYWVLTRPRVRRLFQVPAAPSCVGFNLLVCATVGLVGFFGFFALARGVPFSVLWISNAASSSSGPSHQLGECEDVEWHDDYPLLGGTSAKYAIWGERMAFVVWADRRADRGIRGGGSRTGSNGSDSVSWGAGVYFDDTYLHLKYEIEGDRGWREGTLSINDVPYDLARGSLFLVTIKDHEPVVVQIDRDTMTMKPGKESLEKLARETPEVAAFLAGSKTDE